MSLLKRVRDILASNIHAKMEQSNDPEKEVNQFIREMERDLREIQAETDAKIAVMNRYKRNLEECNAEIQKMDRYMEKALQMNDEPKARKFAAEKVNLKKRKLELEKQYEITSLNVEQIKLAQDKLKRDLIELKNRRDMLANRLSVAKSTIKKYEVGPSTIGLTTFDQLEEKANRVLAEAEALAELRNDTDAFNIDNEIEKLKGK